jgi:hypothetical protein
MRPTHVMVASPTKCDVCKGTGLRPAGYHSFEYPVNSAGQAICPNCRGARLEQHMMTLEDFAALFTYGKEHSYTEGGETVRPVIMVAPNESDGS